MSTIKATVDKYFAFMEEIGGLLAIDEQVPEIMHDVEKTTDIEDCAFWKPLDSSITEIEIKELEEYFGHEVPATYKMFLQHKHFVELQLGGGIDFFPNVPGRLITQTKGIIDEYYPSLIERNYLPFARLGDHGVVAFDANKESAGNNYPIVTFTHDDEYDVPEEYAMNFEDMFNEFDSHLNAWIETYRSKEKTPHNST